MPDDFENWERISSKREKETFRARKQLHGRATPQQNPYRAEAERDRRIFRWAMAVLIVVGVVAFVAFTVIRS